MTEVLISCRRLVHILPSIAVYKELRWCIFVPTIWDMQDSTSKLNFIPKYTMVSAVYILHWADTDVEYLRCELLLHRSFHNDVPEADTIVGNFNALYKLLQPHERTPFLQAEGVNYIHLWGGNDIVILAVARANVNALLTVTFLHQLYEILVHYFDQHARNPKNDTSDGQVVFEEEKGLTREAVVDNYALIYELLDECMDFGLIQLTDYNILKEYIKMELNQSGKTPSPDDSGSESDYDLPRQAVKVEKKKKDTKKVRSTHNKSVKTDVINADTSFINSSIVRTQALSISWRPKGIFYAKNEIYIDIVEHCDFLYDLETETVKINIISGVCEVKSYLSGMPQCKLGLNEKYISQIEYDGDDEEEDTRERPGNQLSLADDEEESGPKRLKVPIRNVQFHQCIELSSIYKENLIYFTPPDDKFTLLAYSVEQQRRNDKKPLILVNPVFKVLVSQRQLHVMCSLSTNFKKRLHCKKLVVKIPVNPSLFQLDDLAEDNFRFKAELGEVHFKVDTSELLWAIEDVPGSKKCVRMMAQLALKQSDHINAELIQTVLFHRSERQAEEEEETTVQELDRYYGVNGVSSSLFGNIQQKAKTKTGNDITVDFDIPMLAYSGLRVTYLRVDEDTMKYTCFPWVRYLTSASNEQARASRTSPTLGGYRFKLGPKCFQIV